MSRVFRERKRLMKYKTAQCRAEVGSDGTDRIRCH